MVVVVLLIMMKVLLVVAISIITLSYSYHYHHYSNSNSLKNRYVRTRWSDTWLSSSSSSSSKDDIIAAVSTKLPSSSSSSLKNLIDNDETVSSSFDGIDTIVYNDQPNKLNSKYYFTPTSIGGVSSDDIWKWWQEKRYLHHHFHQ